MTSRHETKLKDNVLWIDITSPSDADLEQLVIDHALPMELIQDTIDPKHLPKYEKLTDAHWAVIRLFDHESGDDDYSFKNVSRKITIFWKDSIFLSIHRASLPLIDSLKLETTANTSASELLLTFFRKAVLSFEMPLEQMEETLETLETHSMEEELTAEMLVTFHIMRNRLSTFKRLLWHTSSTFQRLEVPVEKNLKLRQNDIRETLNHFLFFSDELLEDTNNLIGLELSLSSQRTNQVIRILTIFSVFFMPLTFIVGVYGMNFKVMPEIDWAYGYLFVWVLMIGVTTGVWLWFKKNKWL